MTSPIMTKRRPANKTGYTFVEMVVLVAILALLAVGVMPSLVGMKAASERRSTIAGVRRVAAEARERAIENGTETQVIYDSSTKQIQVQDVDAEGTATTAKTVALEAGIEPQRFELEGKDSNETDFKLTFTPDGHSNGGGIEFQDFSVLVDNNGFSKFITGTLPDPTDQIWQAGNLEQRN